MARPRKGSKSTVKVNFKDVENRKNPPDGDYPTRVLEAKMGQSGNGNDQIEVTAEISRGEYKGYKGYVYLTLQENTLWKLAAFMTALGLDVPADEVEVDPSDFVDKEFVGVYVNETYNGKKSAKLRDFDSLENYTGDLDEDEPKKGKKKKGKKDKDADEGDSKSDAKGKKDKGKKSKSDEPEEKSKKGKGKKSKDEDADADEGKKKGKKDKGGKKKPSVTFKSDDIQEMSAKKLQKLIDEHELDVDLDDYKTDRKKAGAVIDALEAKDMIAD